jgi:hypothetical protein
MVSETGDDAIDEVWGDKWSCRVVDENVLGIECVQRFDAQPAGFLS